MLEGGKMSAKVKTGGLADAVMLELSNYSSLAANDMKEAVKAAAKAARDEISSNAPVKTGEYAKSWKYRISSESSNAITVTVYSWNRYSLAHLLEFGHALRYGGRSKAIPHIKPAEERAAAKLEEDIRKALEHG